MKSFILTFVLFIFCLSAQSQDSMMINKDTAMVCKKCFCNIVSVGGKYYFNTLKSTRTTLASSGFMMDQEAFEYQLRLFNLPKIFYFQQLGTLSNTNYASVTGFGLKQDIRFPVFKNSNFVFTPYLELGAGYYKLNIAKGITSNSISTVLNSQVENYFLDSFVFTGDVGVELGYGFEFDNRRLNILVNGGFISNIPSEWRIGSSLAFKEKINFASPYAGVTLKLDMGCNKCGDSTCK